MRLQDYLHYYMGCKVITIDDNEQAELVGVSDDNAHLIHDGTGSYGTCDISGVKPLLRRLEDMTEEEARGFLNQAKPHSEYIFHNEHAVCWQYQGSKSEIWFLFGPPAGFHYLLQQSFDLFGLIDAGLAINIKTLTP